jgi:hypothetical protein
MALSAGIPVKQLSEPEVDFAPQLDSTVIYQGGIVMLDSVGRAKPGAVATGCVGVGVCAPGPNDLDRFDNTVTGHADGFLSVRFLMGTFGFKNDGSNPFLSTTQPGVIAYIVDDQTVSVSSNGSTRSPAGRFNRLDSTGYVYVDMSKTSPARSPPRSRAPART